MAQLFSFKDDDKKITKEKERIFSLLAKPLSDSQNKTRLQDFIIYPIAGTKAQADVGPGFIMGCLLYILLKIKSLRVAFVIRHNNNPKSKESANIIYLPFRGTSN